MATLRIDKLNKSYGEAVILRDIDLSIPDGEFVVLVGPSGCGKSTLLRMIAGLDGVTNGDIFIGDKRVNDLEPSQRKIAMVFQSYALYPHMNVKNNMTFGLKFSGMPQPEVDRRVADAARMLRLEPLLDRRPRDLSGGQRQRVAIGRAIVREPDVFLFDEPLSNLDAALRVSTRVEIAKLHKLLKATMVYVTHDQIEALTFADKVVVMNDGKAVQIGTPAELFERPEHVFVGYFIGSPGMNFFPAKVSGAHASVAGSEFALGAAYPDLTRAANVQVGVRPEFVTLTTKPGLPVQLRRIADLGRKRLAYVELGPHSIVATVPPEMESVGDGVAIAIDPANTHVYVDEARVQGAAA